MQPERRARSLRVRALAAALAVIGGGVAEAQVVSIEPSINGRLTYTDNTGASAEGRDGGFVAELSPAVLVSRRGGRIDGRLNARLRNVHYFDDGAENNDSSFLNLRADAKVEAVTRLLFVDFAAGIDRTNISSFQGRSSDDFLSTDERNETRTYSVAPRLEFKLGGEVDTTVSYLHRWLDSGASGFERQELSRWGVRLSDPNRDALFGWLLEYQRHESSYQGGTLPSRRDESGRASLIWNAARTLRVQATVGRENNNYGTGIDDSSTITGVGFDWTPTPRTTLSGRVEERAFGRGYDFAFRHRRSLSAWQLSLGRDISSTVRPLTSSVRDVLYQQLFDELAVIEPDPVLRDVLARERLEQLGISDTVLAEAVVTNAQYVSQHLRGTVSLTGARNTLTFTVQRSDRERLGEAASGVLDDFSTFSRVKTTSMSLSLNHRLTSRTSASAIVTRSRAEGEDSAVAVAETRRLLASLGLNSRLGPKTVGALNYRYQRSEGTSEFRENAVIASVTMRF